MPKPPPLRLKLLICGMLPPPYFGHSMVYEVLMASEFAEQHDITFLDMQFWSYAEHKQLTITKLVKMLVYFMHYIYLIAARRPKYVLYAISFDVLPFWKDLLFCGVGILLGRRVILHDMGQYAGELYDTSGPLRRPALNWLLAKVTGVLVLGRSQREIYTRLLPKAKILVGRAAVADSQRLFPVNNFPIESRPAQTVRVLSLAFVSVSKGIWTTMHALPAVVARVPHAVFEFAGPFESEALQQALLAFVSANNLEQHVTFSGYVSTALTRTRLYRSADLFLFPSNRDAFSLVLLHAIAEGLPVISTFEGAIPEIIEDGITGFLVKKGDSAALGDRLCQLLGDTQLRQRMGRAARVKYLNEFTPQRFAERLEKLFQQVEGH
jgi:glycosyltransferase involved in cell wall biosynthesis